MKDIVNKITEEYQTIYPFQIVINL